MKSTHPLYPFKLDKNITLKRLRADDAEIFFMFVETNKIHLERYDPFFKEFTGVKETSNILGKIQNLYDKGKSLSCGIWENNKIVGYFICGLDLEKKAAHPGYAIAKDHEGKGIVARTAQVVLGYAFDKFSLEYAWVTIQTDNIRSLKVAERLGFKREAEIIPADPIHGVHYEEYKYILTRI